MIAKKMVLPLVLLFCGYLLLTGFHVLAADDTPQRIPVQASGHAAIQTDRGAAKEAALKDALRNALETALGARITATTVMENLEIKSDVVISQTWGHVLSYKILKEWEMQGNYYVTVSAEVSSDTKWWAQYEGILDVIRLHVKDLVLKRSLNAPDPIQPGAVYKGQILIIPVKGMKYRLVAMHTDSNQIMWQRDLPDRLTVPLITDGDSLIIVTKNQVLTMSLQFGLVKWKYNLDDQVSQPPAISNGALYLTTQKGRLLALNIKNGNLLWQYASQSYFLTGPMVAGDRLYFSDGTGYLHALDLTRQSRIFKQMISPKLRTTPAPTPILTYLAWNDVTDHVRGVNSVDGTTVWDFNGDINTAPTTALQPYLSNGKALVVFNQARQSRIYLIDAKTGLLLWKQTLDETVTEITGIGNGVVILNTWEGIRILDFEHGSMLWETAGSSLKAQLVLGGERLFYLHDSVIDVFE